jgi:hypothetical protein
MIASLERQVASAQEKLAAASGNADSALIRSASQELAQAQKDLNSRMAEWEEAVQKAEIAERRFVDQIKAFD